MSFPGFTWPHIVTLCDWTLRQIQLPALDIRLSYNDIELFLAIARSIPTGAPALEDPSSVDIAKGLEPAVSQKDRFKAKTEALLGTVL